MSSRFESMKWWASLLFGGIITLALLVPSARPQCGIGSAQAGNERYTLPFKRPTPTVEAPLPTPTMGWSTFNYFIAMHNAELFKETAEAYVKSGLRDAGYNILRIDGGWWGDDGRHRHYYWTESGTYPDGQLYEPGDPHVSPKNYPGGLEALADDLHQRGFKLGFYLDPNISMGVADNYPANGEEQVSPAITGTNLVNQHAQLVADQGVDHLFFDGYAWPQEQGDKPFEVMYDQLRQHARRLERPIIVSINGRQGPQFADEWRTGPDIDHPWEVILECIDRVADPGRSGHGHWANPDYLMVGFIGAQEAKSQMSLWCVAGAPLYLSHDFRVMNNWDRYVLLNTEVIAVNQDPARIPGRRLRKSANTQVWARELADGSHAVVLLNADDEPHRVSVKWTEIGLDPGPAQVRDLWGHKNLGTLEEGYGTEPLPPHGCRFIKVKPGVKPIDTPRPTWAPHPGETPDHTPLQPKGWTYSSNMTTNSVELEAVFDGNPTTSYAQHAAQKGAYLQVNLDRPTTIDRLVIDMPKHRYAAGPNPWPYTVYVERSKFAVSVSKDGRTFTRIHEGTIGPRYTIADFEPVKARALRVVRTYHEKTSAYDDTEWWVHDIYLFNTGNKGG